MSHSENHPGETRADQVAILTLIRTFLSGLKTGSKESMHALLLPDTQTTNIRPGSTTPSQPQIIRRTLQDIIAKVGTGPEMEETIASAAWEDAADDRDRYGGRRSDVRVDWDVGMAWVPYEFRMDGKVTHVGTNVFTLVKRVEGERVGEWVIVGMTDTYRIPGEENAKA